MLFIITLIKHCFTFCYASNQCKTYLERDLECDLDLERDLEGLRDGLRLPERDREAERDLTEWFDATLLRDRRDPTLPASDPLPE